MSMNSKAVPIDIVAAYAALVAHLLDLREADSPPNLVTFQLLAAFLVAVDE